MERVGDGGRAPNANDVFLSSLTFGRLVKELLSVCSFVCLKACVVPGNGLVRTPHSGCRIYLYFSTLLFLLLAKVEVDNGNGSIKAVLASLIGIKVQRV